MPTTAQFPLAVVLKAVDKVTGPLRGVQGSFARFGASMSKLGSAITLGASLPMAALLGSSLRTGAAFERSMQKISAAAGRPRQELKGLASVVRELGKEPPFNVTQMADAAEQLLRSGETIESVIVKLPQVANLAAGAGIELSEAVQLMADSAIAFRLPAERAEELVDKIAKGAAVGGRSASGFASALAQLTPKIRDNGLELDDVVTSLAALNRVGLQGSKVAPALIAFFGKLQQEGPKVVDVMSRLKINKSELFDADGNLRSLTGTFKRLAEAGATAHDMTQIFGQDYGSSFAAVLERGGKVLEEVNEGLKDYAGEGARRAQLATEGVGYSFERLAGAFGDLQIAVSEAGALEGVGGFLEKLTELVNSLAKTNPELLKTVTNLGAIVIALGPVLKILGWVTTGVARLWGWLGKLGAGVDALIGKGWGRLLGVAGLLTQVGGGSPSLRREQSLAWLRRLQAERGVESSVREPRPDVLTSHLTDEEVLARIAALQDPRRGYGSLTGAGRPLPGPASQLVVDFKNVPPGVQIDQRASDDLALDLRVGYALGH